MSIKILVQESNAPLGAHRGSKRWSELHLLKQKLENPWHRSRSLSKGRGWVPAPTDPPHSVPTLRKVGAIAHLCGSSVFTTEPFPRGRHHPAEALLLFHKVAASTVGWKTDRGRSRRRSLHKSGSFQLGSAQSCQFPSVPLPLINVAV